MKNIKILDCTLRDGGRVIDCAFRDDVIQSICEGLAKSNIDLVEVGFIRNNREYKGDSTFFTKMEQITSFLHKRENTKYLIFVDFGMFDESVITPRMPDGIDGIRFGFTKKNFDTDKAEIKRQIQSLQNKGYEIYFQDVNTPGYTDAELLELIAFANECCPVSFGIVDTYGSMDIDDLDRIFSIIHHNLNSEIAVDFHSHNNMQLSFALSQEMVKLCRDSRKLLIDATLNGMGKCAGNLNLELIVSYMNRKLHCNYEFDMLLDIIDEYLYEYKQQNEWGYSIPSFMAGIYKAHPNNVIYLTEKFRLRTKDIRHIIARIDEGSRQTYNYDNIQHIYIDYSAHQIDDKNSIALLKEKFADKLVLVLVPGNSIHSHREKILHYVEEIQPIILSVNFDGSILKPQFEFYGNIRRYEKSKKKEGVTRIISSNIVTEDEDDISVNYYDLIESEGVYFDNSTIMLLNLLKRLDIKRIAIAGFDGFSESGKDFVDNSFYGVRFHGKYQQINTDMEKSLRKFWRDRQDSTQIQFLTPSIYQKIFG